MDKQNRICECREIEEYHTLMSLKATKEGDIARAKEHTRKAQTYRQEVNNLLTKSDTLIDGK